MIQKTHLAAVSVALSLALFTMPVMADGFSIHEAGGEIVWSADKAFGNAHLVVSGPNGYRFDHTFTDGETPSLYLLGGLEEAADGGYKWSLTLSSMVSDSLRSEMDAARAAGDVSHMEKIKAEGRFESSTYDGHFVKRGGQLVVPELSGVSEALGDSDTAASAKAALPSKAQVFVTDLIVQGSECIGLDCTNNESFGFDTLRLKENNLRIKFEDTSNSGSFSGHDWQITANDSANGGASYLAFEDITTATKPFLVEGGAPNNALYVKKNGRVGIKNANPVVDLHITEGNTPTLRLEQDGSDGFTPQTWDLAGNESNFFIRDVTNGSHLSFRIKPGAPEDTLFLGASGNVGIGTDGPDSKLHVRSTVGEAQIHVEETSSGTAQRVLAHLENNGFVSFLMTNSAVGDSWVFSNKNSEFEISKGGTGVSELLLDSSGNLTILGSLTTAGSTYPDYVFRDGYDLMPLDEVEAFINTNGHLPNVKSEEDVEFGKRINITELGISLLEKVEELTLHTIEQHKTIEQLSARLSALEAAQR